MFSCHGFSNVFQMILVTNKKLHPIPNDPFEMSLNPTLDDLVETSTPFTKTLAQNDNINVILNEQVLFFTKDGKV